MPKQHSRNLGQTSLRGKRRVGTPMQNFDALPLPLRQWLGQATLPWSPTSARRIWSTARARGLSEKEALSMLSKAEAGTLSRDTFASRTSRDLQS
jgi:hypothetical protein